MSEQQMPARIWADPRTYEDFKTLEGTPFIRADIAERMADALRRAAEGWTTVLELDLLPTQHRIAATILRNEARAALSAFKDGSAT